MCVGVEMRRSGEYAAPRAGVPPNARSLRTAADAYLQSCFARETPPHVSELAQSLQMSLGALSKTFKSQCGERPSEYLKRAQIRRAKLLLVETRLPLNQVAYRSAFGTRVSFFRAFKRSCGITPQQYRDDKKTLLLDPR